MELEEPRGDREEQYVVNPRTQQEVDDVQFAARLVNTCPKYGAQAVTVKYAA
jgi:hypothetical protein